MIAEGPAGRRRLPQRRTRRGRLRQQHDEPDVPPGPVAGPGDGAGRRGGRHRTGPPCQRRPLAGDGLRAGVTVRSPGCIPRPASSTGTTSKRQVNERTKVLAIGAASNALGTISDVARAGEAGPDGRGLDLRRRRPLCPAPPGRRPGDGLRLPGLLGLQVLRPACRASSSGGATCSGRSTCPSSGPAPTRPPTGWRPGTQNHEGIAGTAAADRLPRRPGRGARPSVAARDGLRGPPRTGDRSLVERLWSGLRRDRRGDACSALGPDEPRTPTVSFAWKGIAPVEVCRRLADRGIFASHGDFYATTAVERLGHADDRAGPDRLRLLHHRPRRSTACSRLWRISPDLMESGSDPDEKSTGRKSLDEPSDFRSNGSSSRIDRKLATRPTISRRTDWSVRVNRE